MCSKDRAIAYWTMGQRFLRIANVTSEQLVVTGRTHKFTILIQKLKEYLNEDSPFIKKIESYTASPNSIIKNFLDTNKITIDNWYESLKYPENNDNQEFTHLDLIYNSLRSLDFWKNLSSDSLEIIKLSRKYYLENRDN